MVITNILNKVENELRNYTDSSIIVEGIKDKEVLAKFGFNNIITLSGQSLIQIVEDASSANLRSVVILTDFDCEGAGKASNLSKLFHGSGVVVDVAARKRFKRLFNINKIEEMRSFMKLLEDDYFGKTCSIYDKIFNRSRILSRRASREARYNRRNIRSDRRIAWTGS